MDWTEWLLLTISGSIVAMGGWMAKTLGSLPQAFVPRSQIDARFQSLESRIDRDLSAQDARTDKRFDQVDAKLDRILERIDMKADK